jgi:glucose-1-phosphate cytidylyltransferase
MKTIILAGGFGTRLSEYTSVIPKPMVEVGGKPILYHVMNHYAKYGHTDFLLALGYKSEVIKKYFMDFSLTNSDFKVSMATNKVETFNPSKLDWDILLLNTGSQTMTGGRVKRMEKHVNSERFMLTYGDGVSNVNINELVKFHKSHGKMVTVTGVHPVARFGELDIESNKVVSFKEKPQTTKGWINGGFFVIEPEFFSLIDGDSSILEKTPLEKCAEMGELMVYKHDGFWQCMDTKRDKDTLQSMWDSGNAPWID